MWRRKTRRDSLDPNRALSDCTRQLGWGRGTELLVEKAWIRILHWIDKTACIRMWLWPTRRTLDSDLSWVIPWTAWIYEKWYMYPSKPASGFGIEWWFPILQCAFGFLFQFVALPDVQSLLCWRGLHAVPKDGIVVPSTSWKRQCTTRAKQMVLQ